MTFRQRRVTHEEESRTVWLLSTKTAVLRILGHKGTAEPRTHVIRRWYIGEQRGTSSQIDLCRLYGETDIEIPHAVGLRPAGIKVAPI